MTIVPVVFTLEKKRFYSQITDSNTLTLPNLYRRLLGVSFRVSPTVAAHAPNLAFFPNILTGKIEKSPIYFFLSLNEMFLLIHSFTPFSFCVPNSIANFRDDSM